MALHSLCPHLGKGISGIPESALGFSEPQQMLCVVMEEFPGEPLRVSGICCSQRGGVKGAVSPLEGKVVINPFYLLELVGFRLIL